MKLRFSIRDLLWLTLVLAICLGWFIYSRRVASALQAEQAKTKAVEQRRTRLMSQYKRIYSELKDAKPEYFAPVPNDVSEPE